MHLNASGPCRLFGNRHEPTVKGASAHASGQGKGSRRGQGGPWPTPRKPAPSDQNPADAVRNYTHVTLQNLRHCREAAPLHIHNRWPIWRIPEPPILFLLVGKRGNAGNGSESALQNADVAQLVEHHLAKVDVASSNLVVRSQDTVTAKVLFESALTRWVGREARQRPAKPFTRVRIPYPPR